MLEQDPTKQLSIFVIVTNIVETFLSVYKGTSSFLLTVAVLLRRICRTLRIPFTHHLSLRVRLNGVPLVIPFGRALDSEIFYEAYIDKLLGFEPNSRWIIVDIGSHVGLSSIRFASLVKPYKGYVIAIEPNVYVLPELMRNIKFSKLRNIYVLNVAVSDESGHGSLFLCNSDINNSLRPDYAKKHGGYSKRIEVRVVTLLQIYEYLKHNLGEGEIDLLLVDVEGEALNVIRGSSGLFAKGGVKRIKIDIDEPTEADSFWYFFSRMGYHTMICKRSFYAWK